MPLISSDFFDIPNGLVTRNFQWVNNGAGAEQFPATFDDKWRYIEWGSMGVIKVAAAAIGSGLLDLRREGVSTFNQIWGRFFAATDVTTNAALLQGNELHSLVDTFFLTPADIMSGGVIVPPRTIIVLTAFTTLCRFEGVIHEADTLESLKTVLK